MAIQFHSQRDLNVKLTHVMLREIMAYSYGIYVLEKR
jgi:hypothetical protein